MPIRAPNAPLHPLRSARTSSADCRQWPAPLRRAPCPAEPGCVWLVTAPPTDPECTTDPGAAPEGTAPGSENTGRWDDTVTLPDPAAAGTGTNQKNKPSPRAPSMVGE